MATSADRLCLLTVHAHPDDEASKGAPTVARYHAEGIRTVLVCCTGGEEGEILNPALDDPSMAEKLADVRAEELARAAEVIGYEDVVMLGYRDSGMEGSDANAHPDCFAKADLEEAVARLVAVIRQHRPHVMVTYPEDQGGYMHPDHVRVHDVSVPAFERSGDPQYRPDLGEPWSPAKLYYTLWSRKRIEERHQAFQDLGLESPYNDWWFKRPSTDNKITTQVPVDGFIDARIEGLLAHATQIDPESTFWFGLPAEVERSIHPYDDYVLARGPRPATLPSVTFSRGCGRSRLAISADVSLEPLDEGWLEAVAAALETVDASGAADGVAQVTVSGSPGGAAAFHTVVAAGRVIVSAGRHPQPDLVLGWSYSDFVHAWQGGLSLEAAYMSGRMKLEGDQVLLFDGWRPLLRSCALREALRNMRG